MFKSKPHPHQWQHDISSLLLPSASPFSSGCEVERSPEPKPRWSPKPEQIRILEAIFNSGMVNPSREEIRRIRSQLQEYGQVADANVLYWFQNRKSRSKHKLRLLHNNSQPQPLSSSSKSTKPRKNKNKNNHKLSLCGSQIMGMFPSEPTFLFPVSTVGGFEGITVSSQLGFLFGDMNEQPKKTVPTVGPCTGLSEVMNGSVSYRTNQHQLLSEKENEEMSNAMLQQPQPQICYTTTSHQTTSYDNIMLHIPPTTTTITTSDSLAIVPSISDQLKFKGARMFINGMELEVSSGPINVRDAFGEDVVLIDSTCQPIFTDEYGLTLFNMEPLTIWFCLIS